MVNILPESNYYIAVFNLSGYLANNQVHLSIIILTAYYNKKRQPKTIRQYWYGLNDKAFSEHED